MTEIATAPQTAPFETPGLAHQKILAGVKRDEDLSEDAKALALSLEEHMTQQTWGSRSPVVIRVVIGIIMEVEEHGNLFFETDDVREVAQIMIGSEKCPPVTRNMLREGLLAVSDPAQRAKHQEALNRPLTQPDLVAYLASYLAEFIRDQADKLAHELYDREADALRKKLNELTA